MSHAANAGAQTPALHDTQLSVNCYKVRLILALLGVPYRRVAVDLRRGEQGSREFQALNPFGQVPVLVTGGLAMRDSTAILVWLDRVRGLEGYVGLLD